MRIRTAVAAALVFSSATVWASDYLMEGGDPGRTGWVKDEKIFNTTNVKDMKLLWKIKLPAQPREMHNLFPPVIAEKVTTPQGVRAMGVIAGVSDDLFGIDLTSGEVMWTRKFDSTYVEPQGGRGPGTLCPGGQTAVPVLGAGPTPGSYTIYAVSWDGRIRQVNLVDGKDVAPPEKFMPPNAKPYALGLVNGVIYTSNAQGCGGNANAYYAYDLATRKSSIFLPAGGGMWGRRGPSIDPEGRVYMGTGDGNFSPETRSFGDTIVSVKMDANKQMQLVDYFAPPNANFMWRRDIDINVSPVAFDYRGRKFLVGSSKECRVWLLDRDNLGGEDHRTALDTTGLICNDDMAYDAKGVWGALTVWQDPAGTQWMLVPFWGPVSRTFKAPIEYGRPEHGGVAAFKVQEQGGKWKMSPAWLSRDMDMAEEAVVAGGVVFAYGSGEDTRQSQPERGYDEQAPPARGRGSATRIANSTHITVFALDGQTGNELWSSGNQITSWSHFSGISVANGRVYVPTFDGTVYCFGVK
jgi:outer membrane protein assembly factor BamB